MNLAHVSSTTITTMCQAVAERKGAVQLDQYDAASRRALFKTEKRDSSLAWCALRHGNRSFFFDNGDLCGGAQRRPGSVGAEVVLQSPDRHMLVWSANNPLWEFKKT